MRLLQQEERSNCRPASNPRGGKESFPFTGRSKQDEKEPDVRRWGERWQDGTVEQRMTLRPAYS